MTTMKSILRGRLSKNVGGLDSIIRLANVESFDTIAKAPVFANITTTYADDTERDAASPSNGDQCYVTADDKYYEYDGTDWFEIKEVNIYNDHAFAVGKGFAKLESTLNQRNLESSGAEEDDSTGREHKVVFMMPGSDEALEEMVENSLMGQFICLIKDRNGNTVQLGSEDDPAVLKLNSSASKQKATEAPGAEFTITATYRKFYKGAITDLA